MDKKNQLIDQISIVIDKLEKEYINEINDGVLQLIYKRYKNALAVLNNNEDSNRINILGGVRAYMDSYNYYENTLLAEMHQAEKLLKELK
ncbi:hypothetical protein AB685_27495 [Bacillus sp. LL01]|uniref:hypothetical protein n=1 Tax=Bacillus sp. LL01 TaxID=1665556 RepID=UPI00064D0C51|nr:hypothetical protein [Bacillus sp. LL01]KMJ55391.1 hypothetical protein AB685_27495 [Bacillus sp. LL01]